MLTVEQFVGEMLLVSTVDGLSEVVSKAVDDLWVYEVELFRIVPTLSEPLITLPTGAVEVMACAHDRVLLTRATEEILDGSQPTWRSEAAGTPRSYLFRGEVPNGQVRLHPAPSTDDPVHVLCHMRPATDQLVHWQRLYVALKSIELLSISDPIRSRPPVAEFAKTLSNLVTQHLHT